MYVQKLLIEHRDTYIEHDALNASQTEVDVVKINNKHAFDIFIRKSLALEVTINRKKKTIQKMMKTF